MERILNLEEPSFDPAQESNNTLSILLMPDGYSFCICDNATGQVRKIAHFRAETPSPGYVLPFDADTEDKFEMLKTGYNRIYLLYTTREITLVPAKFTSPELDKEFLAFNFSEINEQETISTMLPLADAVLISAKPVFLGELHTATSVKPILLPAAAVWIQSLMRENSHILSRQVFIQKWHGFFELAVIQGRKLLYYNTFHAPTASDLVYYLVFVLEQLGISPVEERLFLMGETDDSTDEYNMLSALFGNLNLYKPQKEIIPAAMATGIEINRYYTLLSVTTCGL